MTKPLLSSSKILLVFFLQLTCLPFLVISQPLPWNSDKAILLSIKKQWGNQPPLHSWDTNISLCRWPGIRCAGDKTVIGISLDSQNIYGEIPPFICGLKNLTILDLGNNYISGEFPTFLYNCSKLNYLNISSNLFIGKLPNSINNLSPHLQHLDLSYNNFSSDIPSSIGQLKSLVTLDLTYNLFDGTFPSELGNLENLEDLTMAINSFSPMKLPTEFGKLKKLKYLWMTQCNLIGEMPKSFANLSSLEHLDLAENNLVGQLPSGLLLLTNLTYLYLYDNQLSGGFPNAIKAMKLREIDVSTNNLRGTIPPEIGNLPGLEILNLFMNQFWGPLPPELGKHSKLEHIDVSDNEFTGQLPENLCSGKTLLGLAALNNRLKGSIPSSLGQCNSLLTLVLRNNSLSGQLRFTLSSELLWLDISNNNFSGPIPATVANWKNLLAFLASNNQFLGPIPVELTALSNLYFLKLDNNQLSGELPSRIVSWKSLATLIIARNNISGMLPIAFGYLPKLNCLELSNNKLSGHIPLELGLVKFSTLDLSYNNLSGKIPSAFDDVAYQYSFLNNPNLCSDSEILSLHRCPRHHTHWSFSLRYFLIILLPCTTILLVIMYIVSRKRKHETQQEDRTMTAFHNVNFTEAEIVNGLTEDHVIGSGGSGKIFRVVVNDSDHKVAVKRMWDNKKLSHVLEKQITAEAEILGKIRHNNIIKLLCCVSRAGSRLLVYEYMENQSLDKWLHRKKNTHEPSAVHSILDWPTRLRIAIGAAKGLCYMHHDCSPSIIHRDVKSSNILLDSEFNSKIADFGLAKMSAYKIGEPHTASAVAGSFGYIAPEYWRTRRLSEKIDIYSFGVVLLELATGKEPCKGNDHLNLAQWSWKHYIEGHPMEDALDFEIKEECYLQEMMNMFKVGLMCTSIVPSSRPSMKQVLRLLIASTNNDASERVPHIGNEIELNISMGINSIPLQSD